VYLYISLLLNNFLSYILANTFYNCLSSTLRLHMPQATNGSRSLSTNRGSQMKRSQMFGKLNASPVSKYLTDGERLFTATTATRVSVHHPLVGWSDIIRGCHFRGCRMSLDTPIFSVPDWPGLKCTNVPSDDGLCVQIKIYDYYII